MQPKIQILSNTNYALADVIKNELMESISAKVAVAFLKKTGLEHIYKSLEYALSENNAKVEFIVGLDFKTTDAKALNSLYEIKKNHDNFNFYCFGDKRDNHNDLVFHPKIYMFDTELSKSTKYTSIVGSSNFTGGGLTTNFEVNTIFKEKKPVYFAQLSAIYDEIKYTDSIFQPSLNYISKYGDVKKELDKSNKKILLDKDIKKELKELRAEEQILPNAIPSLKKLIVELLQEKIKKGIYSVHLQDIYKEIRNVVIEKKLTKYYKMETFENTVRGEINTHEINSNHKANLKLFRRTEQRGFYTISENGKNYYGR